MVKLIVWVRGRVNLLVYFDILLQWPQKNLNPFISDMSAFFSRSASYAEALYLLAFVMVCKGPASRVPGSAGSGWQPVRYRAADTPGVRRDGPGPAARSRPRT